MPFYIDVKMGPETARRLAYAVGRSEEANAIASAARQAAINAERSVRDIVVGMAGLENIKLPDRFSLKFDEDVLSISEVPTEDHAITPNGQEVHSG